MAAGQRREALDRLVTQIRACRICVDAPRGAPLPHEPRPVLRPSATARIAVAGQAPGARVHASGVPFTDPSGERLRAWMGVTNEEFYDDRRIAILPMGFCFPGYDAKGADLPPRKECAAAWRRPLIEAMPQLDLILLVGSYAAHWHAPDTRRQSHTATVAAYETLSAPGGGGQRLFPLPHPSWRNNAWVKQNPWFEAHVIPRLQREVRALL